MAAHRRTVAWLVGRVMLVRTSGAAFAAAVTTLLAVQAHVSWLPNGGVTGLSGLASIGLISTGGTLGGLAANSLGPRALQRYGLRTTFLLSCALQAVLLLGLILATTGGGLPSLGILGIAGLLFVSSVGSPAVSGLARYWWGATGLPPTVTSRGIALEPTFGAIAWSVGPALAAPLVLLTPWAIPLFWGLNILGLLTLLKMPTPPKRVTKATPRARFAFLADWRIPGAYSFYHIARALLNSGLTAVLLGAHQQSLIGAASAAPSLGHTVGGALFAMRKHPDRHLRQAAVLGLLGQATPTLLLAGAFALIPHPNVVLAALLAVGGGVVIGILKAPVASVVYPLAAESTPHLNTVESTALVSNGMILGGLIGPLLATLIITTLGAGWLLPFSGLALGVCLLGLLYPIPPRRVARL